MKNIILALILRELKTRFGKNPTLGYVWVIGEPMLHILCLLVFLSYIRNRVLPQLPYSLFLIMGMVPYFMFRNIVTNIINGIDANKSLFVYKPVKPIHVFLARAILEGMIYFVIFILLMSFFCFILDYNFIPNNFLMVIFSFFLVILFAFTLGLFMAIISFNRPSLKMLCTALTGVFYFASATIFPLWILPIKYAKYMAINPLLHIIETLKENYYVQYPVISVVNLSYSLMFILVLLFFSLAMYYHKRLQLAGQ